VTLLVEKEQVRRLAESLQTWLPELAADRPEDPGEAAAAEAGELALAEPLEPDFRVGQLSLSYDAERDRVLSSPPSSRPTRRRTRSSWPTRSRCACS
jgi:uncharacterized repeat protein (TIGR03847 family)